MNVTKGLVCCFCMMSLLWAGCSKPGPDSATASPTTEEGAASEELLSKEKWLRVDVQASVESIDLATREITLKGPRGGLVTLTAPEEIERFDEIQVGDLVEAEYWTFIRVEFREPTDEEKSVPLLVLAKAGRTPEGLAPAGKVGAVVTAIVQIIDVDTDNKRTTIQGPSGNFVVLPVEDESVLKKLEAGDFVFMTYAEAVALSLRKMSEE
jgi:hypothetical protein